MKMTHDFETPRNIFEKLIRDYEQLDILVTGDAMFNFVSTAYHFQEWIKKSPLDSTESVKRLLRKAARHKLIKLCKEIICAKIHYKMIIDDPAMPEGTEVDFTKPPTIPDKEAYKKGLKTFVFKIGNDDYDPFEFKEEIKNLYSAYFQIK